MKTKFLILIPIVISIILVSVLFSSYLDHLFAPQCIEGTNADGSCAGPISIYSDIRCPEDSFQSDDTCITRSDYNVMGQIVPLNQTDFDVTTMPYFESFNEKYDIVLKGKAISKMENGTDYEFNIQVEKYYKTNIEEKTIFTALMDKYSQIGLGEEIIFGINHHDDKNYFRIMNRIHLDTQPVVIYKGQYDIVLTGTVKWFEDTSTYPNNYRYYIDVETYHKLPNKLYDQINNLNENNVFATPEGSDIRPGYGVKALFGFNYDEENNNYWLANSKILENEN